MNSAEGLYFISDPLPANRFGWLVVIKAQAKELYNEALNYGLNRNTYVEKRL